MAAPTYVTTYTEAYGLHVQASPFSVSSVSWSAGDVLVATASSENGSLLWSTAGPTGGTGLTWTYLGTNSGADANSTAAQVWYAVAPSSQSGQTVSLTTWASGGTSWGGWRLTVWTGTSGVGATVVGAAGQSGAPSLGITTTGANSAVQALVSDWNAVDGASRTYRTVNSITPTAGGAGEVGYARDGTRGTAYGAYWSDAGAAGSKTVGLTAPTGQLYTVTAIEILGTGSGAATPTPASVSATASVPAPTVWGAVSGTPTWQSAGAVGTDDATSPASIAYPASIAAGDLLVMLVGQKPSTANSGSVTTPSGWSLAGSLTGAGGYGATLGADTGNTNIYAYTRTADGTETGNLSLAHATTNVLWGTIHRLSNASQVWDVATATGSDTSAGNVSITFGSNPGLTAGDICIVGMCIPTDVTTPSQFSAEAVTATGATFGTFTEDAEPDSTTGNDIGGVVGHVTVSSGTASAAPVFTATAGGTTTNVRGPAILVRVRGVDTLSQRADVATVATVAAIPAPTVSTASGSNATATPAAVAAVAAVPAPTVTSSATVTPSAVSRAASIGAAVVTAAATVLGTAVPAAAAIPAPTVTRSATVAAAAVAGTASVPTPTVTTSSTATVTAAAVTTTAAVPAPTVAASATAAPAAVAATSAVPAPVAGPAGTTFTGFGTGDPGVAYAADTDPYTLGTAFKVTASGYRLTKIRVFLDSGGGAITGSDVATVGNPLRVTLYGANDTGNGAANPTLLTVVDVPSVTVDAWNDVTVTETALTSGVTYYAAVLFPLGRYSALGAAFASDVVAGPITFPATGSAQGTSGTVANGAFATGGTLQPPTSTFNGNFYGIDVEVTSAATDSTATPAAVTGSAAVPAPTVTAATDVAPSTVPVTAAVPAPTVTASAAVAPASVAATTSVPAATVSTGASSTVSASAVTASTAVPAPTVTASATVAPAAVSRAASVPAPTVSTSTATTVTPAAVGAVAAVPALSAAVSLTVLPDVVTAAATAPAPAVQTGSTATVPAAVVALAAVVPAPTLTASATVAPAAVSRAAAVPAPTVLSGTFAAPAVVAATAAAPAPTIRTGVTVAAGTVPATAAVPAPGITAGSTVTVAASPVATAAAVPAPQASGATAPAPATVTARAAVPLVTIGGATTAVPASSLPAVSQGRRDSTAGISGRVRSTPAVSRG